MTREEVTRIKRRAREIGTSTAWFEAAQKIQAGDTNDEYDSDVLECEEKGYYCEKEELADEIEMEWLERKPR